MKLTLDLNLKSVRVDEPCNLKELFDFMMKHFDINEWIVEGGERIFCYPTSTEHPIFPWYSPQYDEPPVIAGGTGDES